MKDFLLFLNNKQNKNGVLKCLNRTQNRKVAYSGFKEAGKSLEELIVCVYNEFILTADKALSLSLSLSLIEIL